jgi:serine/threonine protein kinase
MANVESKTLEPTAQLAPLLHTKENVNMLVSLQGQTLGKYRILEQLGRGGMAQVYRAYHPQLDRYVAVKVLRSDLLEEEEFLTRFRREAQSVANLRHPNIVQIHDFDVQDDIYYMVMELLEGDTLKAQLTERRSSEERTWGNTIRIMLDVLDGLAFAHHEGIIHRDIKPANIMLTSRGQAVITDFGIAQIIGSTQFTVSGALMGTLSYMAPEQGLEGHTGVKSDLYSLGIVLYEMLTGRPPFDADTPLAILMKHVNDPLPLPHTIDPGIPEPFERIVLKALAKNPEDRYESAEEMATALRQVATEIEAELPERIALAPLTTTKPSSDSVAVFSGADREQISDAPFASDETDVKLDDQLAEETVAEPVFATTRAELAMPKGSRKKIFSALLPALLALIGFNIVAPFLGLVSNNWRIYGVGWPAEILFVGLGLVLIMTATGAPVLLIPAGIILGNGVLLAFYAVTGFWSLWEYLWPLEPLLVLGTVTYTLWLAARGEQKAELTKQAGQRLSKIAIVALVITVAIAAIPIG